MDRTKIVIRANKVSKNFGGVHALEEVDFELRAGEVMGLVGDNGAGKSTLIKVLSGVYQPSDGEIYLDDSVVVFKGRREAKQLGIECVYQDLGLINTLDAPANVFLGSELYEKFLGFKFLNNKKMHSEAIRLLKEKLDIQLQKENAAVFNLSGGQKQAVAISRALYNENIKVLILDEPTAALGPEETEKTLELARKVAQNGTPVILISHNLEEIFATADRVTVLRKGKMVGVREIRNTSKTEVLGLIVGAEEKSIN